MEVSISKRAYDVEKAKLLAAAGLNNTDIARELGVDEASVRRGIGEWRKQYLLPTEDESRFLVELDKPITVEGDVMVTADWHIPLYDPEYVNQMIIVAQENDLRTLVIGGDFFNFDALSQYEPKQDSAGLERELEEGIAVMATVMESFDRILYVWGNHDARMHKSLGMKLQFKNAMRLVFDSLGEDKLTKMEFTNLDHAWVESGGKSWYVCHPANYTRVPLSGARTLATKFQANVITAHSHHCAVGYDISGEYVVAEIGGLFDRHKTAYLQRTTTFPTWAQGFAWIKDGRLGVHSPGWSLV